jgi:hypothetical protein
LERQYDISQRFVDPVIDESQLSQNVTTAGTLLLKLHGDLRHPNRLVVTEDDYDGFLNRYPLLATYLANQLISKTAVLIGYSLDDPDFRQVWSVVKQRLGSTRRPEYSISVGNRRSDVARFERRGVKVIHLPGSREKYGDVLAARFRELREFMIENVLKASTVKEERPLRELSLPRDAENRLCFFSVPIDLLPIYRDRVFPAVEAAGYVPVTADDVVSPGDSVSAKIDALIDRSRVMVAEVSTEWTLAELRIALAKTHKQGTAISRRPLSIIVVVDGGRSVPPEALELASIVRRENWLDDPDDFVNNLTNLLRQLIPQSEQSRAVEARRLFGAREYRAAVIAAMTHLESSVRERLDKEPWTDVRRPMSISALLDSAVEKQMVSREDSSSIRKWISIRNRAVHTSEPVTKAEARDIVDGVQRILGSN